MDATRCTSRGPGVGDGPRGGRPRPPLDIARSKSSIHPAAGWPGSGTQPEARELNSTTRPGMCMSTRPLAPPADLPSDPARDLPLRAATRLPLVANRGQYGTFLKRVFHFLEIFPVGCGLLRAASAWKLLGVRVQLEGVGVSFVRKP